MQSKAIAGQLKDFLQQRAIRCLGLLLLPLQALQLGFQLGFRLMKLDREYGHQVVFRCPS